MSVEELLGRRDKDLERRLICEILVTRKMPLEVKPEFFCGEERRLFDVVWAQWREDCEIDPFSLPMQHRDLVAEIMELDGTSSPQTVASLKNCWIAREFARTVLKNPDKYTENAETAVRTVAEEIGTILVCGQKNEYDHDAELSRLYQELVKAAEEKREFSGYATGLYDFDRAASGIEKGKTYVVGALKKTGKSRFMIYLAAKMAAAGAKVLVNSLEMSAPQLNILALAYHSGIDSSRLSGFVAPHLLPKIAEGIAAVKNMAWQINRDYEIPQLRSRIVEKQMRDGCDVVFVDFIQRMRAPHFKADRVREVEFVAQNLANISRECNVAIIALSQLSGLAERLGDGEVPSMQHYKESQAIPENADTIITLHNPKRNDTSFTNDGLYHPENLLCRIEQRYGISGITIKILADLRTCDFKNLSRDQMGEEF